MFVNPSIPIHDVLSRLVANPTKFRDLTNFTIDEYVELCNVVVPTIQGNARSIGIKHVISGRPSKLSRELRLLNFIIYMKHNTIYFDSMLWNWSRLALCDDAIFVASCVNEAIAKEIRWPSLEKQGVLGAHITQLRGCIGFMDFV